MGREEGRSAQSWKDAFHDSAEASWVTGQGKDVGERVEREA